MVLQDFCERGCRSSGLSSGTLSATQSCDILSAAREQAQAKAGSGQSACSVEDVLQLLRILFTIGGEPLSGRTLQEGKEVLLRALSWTVVFVFHYCAFITRIYLCRCGRATVQCITRGIHQQKNYNQNPAADRGNLMHVWGCYIYACYKYHCKW